MKTFLFATKLMAPIKETLPNVSAGQRTDSKEETELKEEQKKETTAGPAEEKLEESKEEEKPDQKVKEEKPGESRSQRGQRGILIECRWKHKVLCFLPSDGEKSAEEKEKEKEAPAATEVTDVKDKSEAADMKKGTSLYPRLARLSAKHTETARLLLSPQRKSRERGRLQRRSRPQPRRRLSEGTAGLQLNGLASCLISQTAASPVSHDWIILFFKKNGFLISGVT